MNGSLLHVSGALEAGSPKVLILGILLLAYLSGAYFSRLHMARDRRIAAAIADRVRKTQGKYDLASRDVMQVRRSVLERLAKDEQSVNRWTQD